MNPESLNWERDVRVDPEEEYQAFVRSLRRRKGFGLLFVRCSPAEGERLIKRVKQDIPSKKIEVLPLEKLNEPIDSFYKLINSIQEINEIDILFITGIEKSLIKYIKPGHGGQGDYYKLDTVPRVLGDLNLRRELFRDNFNTCFVFIVPLFALKYFIKRSPDFFDWRSGVFEFPTETERVLRESSLLLLEGDYQKYLNLTPQEQGQEIIRIQELLAESVQTPLKAHLQLQLGTLLTAAKQYDAAFANYDQAVKLKPDFHQAWNNRGIALSNLGRYEESVASYDQAVKLKPDYHEALYARGIALSNLGRYEEAVASYDQIVKLKPDDQEAWYERGIALNNLGRDKEAVASFNQARELNQARKLTLALPIMSSTNKDSSQSTPEVDIVTIRNQGRIINPSRSQAESFLEDLGNGIIMEMVSIPGGKFLMGSPDTEKGRFNNESPQHEVTVAPFLIGKTQVTQAQWKAVAALPEIKTSLNSNPSHFKGVNRPVECVSWYDVIEFCGRLSKKTGREYRLPSEAEWEYACRAGTTTPFHFGETITTDLANYDGNYTYGSVPKGKYRQETTVVGSFNVANAFGLYDMHGNVYEWCADPWHENYNGAPSDGKVWEAGGDDTKRLLRGGSWYNYPGSCRAALRDRVAPDCRSNDFGFRVVVVPVAWTL